MDIFEACRVVNDHLSSGNEAEARNELIQLLDEVEKSNSNYTPLVNKMIRDVGLFPYLETANSSWEERYIYDLFKVDVGEEQPITLHREQSRLLNSLLAGKSIAVSAPTSFGKSFVIDSFISIKRPKNVVILVPTIALADETRRRLQRKFGGSYKIITTSEVPLSEMNILVFPQERVFGYLSVLKEVDILIVDEFYKASAKFDRDRSPALIKAILALTELASQRYFLAPNINELSDNEFTKDMEFLRLDFNTVFLQKNELYKDIGKDEAKKSAVLLDVIRENPGKTLIYAGTYPNIKKLSNLLMDTQVPKQRDLLGHFQKWLAKNYDPNWELTRLVVKGVGIHNGQLHRSLSQVQIKLFEDEGGLDCLISTSSIIEGVNTSAENVVVWSNKNGKAKINDFTYKNIIGRGGRMFRHFIGKVFVLEEPPKEEDTQLSLDLPDALLGMLDGDNFAIEYTQDQLDRIDEYRTEMGRLVGEENLSFFQKTETLQNSNSELILRIARDIRGNQQLWNGLRFLNSDDTSTWDRLLYRIINLNPAAWEVQWSKYIGFLKVLTENWRLSIPDLLDELSALNLGLDEFFKLERNTTFKLTALLSDVNVIYNKICPNTPVDLSPAIAKFSNAFLPPLVFQLEEYGLPRMISKKIQASQVMRLDMIDVDIHTLLERFRKVGLENIVQNVDALDDFDVYILRYFFDGIHSRVTAPKG